MTAKEYLSRYKLLDTEIALKLEQAEKYRELAESVSHMSGGGSGAGDKIGRTVAKLVDLENEINAEIDKLVLLKQEIETTIAAVDDPTLRQLLTLKYINGHTFEQISVDLHYSRMQICRMHVKALKAVENVIECYIRYVL